MIDKKLKVPRSRRVAWETTASKSPFSLFSSISRSRTDVGESNDRNRRSLVGAAELSVPVPSVKKPTSHTSELDGKGYRGDVPDAIRQTACIPDKIRFSVVDILFVIFSIATYLADVGLDCFVAYKHYLKKHDHPWYFFFTTAFIILAGVVASLFSLWWYFFECQTKKRDRTNTTIPTGDTFSVVLRIISCALLMATITRYIDTIRYGLKSRSKRMSPAQRKYYFDQMQFERVDGAMLRLVEAFLEAAPQLLLQMYIVFKEGLYHEASDDHILATITLVSIISSMGSLAWSIVAYHKALRMSRDDRQNINHAGLFLRFLWRLFEVAPRVIIFAMFMYACQFYLGVFMAVHWVIASVWLFRMNTDFCEKRACEVAFVMLIAFFWIFCFFNVKDGHTRGTALVYYIIFYLENIGLTAGWLAVTRYDPAIWYRELLCTVLLGSFWIAVSMMIIYYKCFHPEPIQTCLPLSEWWPSKSAQASSTGDSSSEREGLQSHRVTGSPMLPSGPTILRLMSTPNSYSPPAHLERDISDDTSNVPLPPYRAPTPEPPGLNPVAEDSPYLDDNSLNPDQFAGDEERESGYIEAFPVQQLALRRKDTAPKYRAPVPNKSNYGITIPGGSTGLLSLLKPENTDLSSGTTLPGATTTAVIVNGAPDAIASSQDDRLSFHRDRPPRPLPRMNTLPAHRDSTLDVSSDQEDSSNLTIVTDSSNLSPFMVVKAPVPSPRHSFSLESPDNSNNSNCNTNSSSPRHSFINTTTPGQKDLRRAVLRRDSSVNNSCDDLNVTVDTPLRVDMDSPCRSARLGGYSPCSPDTPMRMDFPDSSY